MKGTRLLREKHEEGVYRKEHLDYLVKPLIELFTEIFEDARIQYNKHWRDRLKRLKIFCVSENNTGILMWSHYAKYHTGVCFKLKVLPAIDNTICAAQKVNYLSNPPAFFEIEEWIDSVVLQKQLDFTNSYHQYPLAKSNVWEYEQEWRVWDPYGESGSLYLDVPIAKGEIDTIYFGANSKADRVNELISVASKHGVNNFFRAIKSVKKYGVEFQKI